MRYAKWPQYPHGHITHLSPNYADILYQMYSYFIVIDEKIYFYIF